MTGLSKKNQLLCIVGPTSSGKTSLSIKFAEKYNGEIISSDSRQLYKEMNIGTNKIQGLKILPQTYPITERKEPANAVEYQGITHYLIGIIKPDEDFSLYQFKETAVNLIKKINKKGKLAIMAGGTGLYVSSITDNLQIPQIPPDKKLRAELEKKTTQELYKIFKEADTTGSRTIDKNNKRRLIRAIEICKNSPTPYSVLRYKKRPLFKTEIIGIKTDRKILYQRINQWIDSIFGDDPKNSPIVKETKDLIAKYDFEKTLTLQGLVYKQVGWYLLGYPSKKYKARKLSFEEAREAAQIATRRYAKRQLTWFRKDKKIKWLTKDEIRKKYGL